MAFKVADLFANLSLRTAEFSAGIKSATAEARTIGAAFSNSVGKAPRKEMRATEKQITGSLSSIRGALKDTGRVVTGILISQLFYTMLRNIKDATSAVIQFKGEMEQAAISFSLMLGSKDKADAYMVELKKFAATTPFTMASARQASQQLLAMGWQIESVLPTLRTFLDAASIRGASPDTINRITLAFGQMKAAGRVLGGEIRQLYEIGIPALQILQEELGLTNDQLGRIGELRIPADEAISALLRGMDKRFTGASKLLARTLPGLLSTLSDNLLSISEVLISKPYADFKGYIRGLTQITEELDLLAQEKGAGAVFKRIVPEGLQASLVVIIASIRELKASFGLLFTALKPVIAATVEWLTRGLANVLPIVNLLIRSIAVLAYVISKSTVVTRLLGLAIAALAVSGMVSVFLTILRTAIVKLHIAAFVAKSITLLRNAIIALNLAIIKTPLIGLIAILSVALVGLIMSSKATVAWLDRVMQRISALLGINIESVWQESDLQKASEGVYDFYDSLSDSIKGLKGTGKAAQEAGKKIKDGFLASFDEVYNIPDKDSASDALLDDLDNLADIVGKEPDLSLFDDLMKQLDSSKVTVKLSDKVDGLIDRLRKAFEDAEPIKLPPIVWPTPPDPPPPMIPVESIEQILLVLTGAFVLFKLRLREWAVSTGSIINDWVAQRMLDLRNFGLSGLNAVKTFTSNTALGLKQWSLDTAQSISSWGVAVAGGMAAAGSKAVETVKEWTEQTSQSISSWATNLGMAIVALPMLIKESLSTTLSNIGTTLNENLQMMASFWENHKQSILLIVLTLVAGVVIFFIGLPTAISGALVALVLLVTTAFVDTKEAVAAEIGETKEEVLTMWEEIKEKLGSIFERIQKKAVDSFSGMKSGIKGAVNYIIDMVNKLIEKFNEIEFTIPEVTIPFVGTFGGYTVGVPQVPKLPRLASGGIVYKDTIAQIGEGARPEAVVPLSSEGLRPFAKALMNEMSFTGTGGSQADRPIVYVHTMIADDRGLRDLERRLEVVRVGERQRRGES